MLRFIVLISLLFFATLGKGQAPAFYSFNQQYGWEVETVYDLYFDSNDLMWFGTSEGLYRFDGREFTHFASLGFEQEYSSIQEDPDGRIWFKNFSGQLFFLENDSVHLFTEVKDFKSFSDFSIVLFPKILISNNFALYTLDFYSGEEKLIHKGDKFQIPPQQQSADLVYVSFFSKSDSLSKIGKRLFHVATFDGLAFEPIASKAILNSDLTTLNVSDKTYLFQRHFSSSTFSKITKGNIETIEQRDGVGYLDIQNCTLIQNDLIAVCTRRGYFVWRPSQTTEKSAFVLPELSVSAVQKDRLGNTWVTSTNKGVYISPNDEITAISLPSDELLFACNDTSGNAWLIDFEGRIFDLNTKNGNARLLTTEPTAIGKPFWNRFRNELFLSASKKLVSLNTGAISPYNRLGLSKDIAFLTDGVLGIIFSERTDIQWNTNLADSTQLPLGLVPSDFSPPVNGIRAKNLRYKRGRQLGIDQGSGNLYVNYSDGLFKYETTEGAPVLIDQQPLLTSALVSDAHSGFWAATIHNQLARIHGSKGENRFPIETKAQQLLQWKSFLFIVEKFGIVKLDTLSGKSSTIDFRDGLYAEAIKHAFVYDDTLRLLTKAHLHKIPCGFDGTNTHIPKGWIKSISLFDSALPLDTAFDLSHSENNLTIQFGAIDINSRNTYTFQYRMQGVSDDWITNSFAVPYARFPKLLPGEYQFEMRVCNEDNYCSDSQTIQFSIHAPFFQRWWFYLLLTLFSGFVIAVIIRWRTQRTREREKLLLQQTTLKKEISQAKIASFRAQMNPHFMFNALNSIQKFIVSNQKDIASEYLSDFADLMRKYLDQSKFEQISLQEEIETLELYLVLEKLRFDKVLFYEVNVSKELKTENEMLPIMLLQPFVENSLKHGLLSKKGTKRLTVRFDPIPKGFVCTIEDNGVGRKRAQEINKNRKHHQSFATSAIAQRLQLTNAARAQPIQVETTDLYNDQNQASGTRVVITIPDE